MRLSWRIRGAILAAALVLGGGSYAAWRRLYPIESTEWIQAAELRLKHGASVASLGAGPDAHEAFEKSTCRPGEACRCVLLVHGLGDNALTWRRIFSVPAKEWGGGYDFVAVNLPGTGGTPAPREPDGYRARRLAQGLVRALQARDEGGGGSGARNCARWTVAGNSFGGWVAAWVALEWPEGVERLLLIGSAGLKAGIEKRDPSLFAGVEGLKEFQRRAYAKPRELPAWVWEAAARRASGGSSSAVMAAQTVEDALDGELSRLRLPVLLLWGAADRIILPEQGKAMAAGIGGAVYRELPGCGHMPQKECPGEVVRVLR